MVRLVIVKPPDPGCSMEHIDFENSYILPTTGTKGLILILNIAQFDNERWRAGSEKDVENLAELFRQMDFKINPASKQQREKIRKTKEDIKSFIQAFKQSCTVERPESVFIYIGSHGHHPFQIVTSDDKRLDLFQDIVHEFDHDKCPVLKGKPKVFIVQACQNYVERTETDNSILREPVIADTLICYAGMPGETVLRDHWKGSWFVHVLTNVMMNHVRTMSLQDILEITGKSMTQIKGKEGIVQVLVTIPFNFKKNFYFYGREGSQATVRKFCRPPAELEEFIKGNSKLAITCTMDMQITCDKISDNLKNYRLLEWEEFAVSVSSSSRWRDENGLVFVKNCFIKNLKELNQAQLGNVSKVVFVTLEDESEVKDYVEKQLCWGTEVKVSMDNVEWDDLTVSHKLRITKKLEEDFQLDSECLELKEKVLVDLINGKEMKIFKDTIPEELSFYVPRRLRSRTRISNMVFYQNSSDVFLFSGIERYQLSQLASKNKMTGSSYKYLVHGREVNFMVLDRPNHFEKICAKTSENVHLLKYENGALKWIKSKGDLRRLQIYIELAESQDDWTEEEFYSKLKSDCNQHVCISDAAGVGKSRLLEQIGRKLTKMYPDRSVFLIKFGEFIRHIKEIGLADKLQATEKVLEKLLCENVIGEAVLRSKLNSKEISIELLLDGVDEVDTDDKELVHQILKTIKLSLKSVRLWVTCRPNVRDELENNLGILGYTIQPFCEEDQVQFLTHFWAKRSKLNEDRAREFARHCLNSLQVILDPWEIEGEITETPLHCFMIGLAYEEEATEYAEVDGNYLDLKIGEIGSVSDLFGRMMASKLPKLKSKGPTEKTGLFTGLFNFFFGKVVGESRQEKGSSEEMLMDMHASLAIKELFPKSYEHMKKLFVPVDMEQVMRAGLLESSSTAESPKFIHRTFGDHFIAGFLIKTLIKNNGWTEELANFLFDEVLRTTEVYVLLEEIQHREFGPSPPPSSTIRFEFTNHVLVYFLNSLISDEILQKVHLSVATSLVRKAEKEERNDVCQIAGASVCSNFVNIFKLLNETKVFVPVQNIIFNTRLLQWSVVFSELEVVKTVMREIEKGGNPVPIAFLQSLRILKSAVSKGDFSIVEFLIKEKEFRSQVEEVSEENRSLLFRCVMNSKTNCGRVVEQKIQIIRYLAGINPELVKVRDPGFGETLLLFGLREEFRGNVRLLTELISLGVDLLGRNKENETVIHLSPYRNHLSNEEYHSLLMSIPEDGLGKLVKAKNNEGETPLTTLVKYMKDPMTETLEMFKELGADFRSEVGSINEFTCLERINKLMEFGAEVSLNRRCQIEVDDRGVDGNATLENFFEFESPSTISMKVASIRK